MGNPHLHGAELKTENTLNHALLSQTVRETWRKSYFIMTLIQMEVLQEVKMDEKTYYTCKPEGYFKNMSPSLSGSKDFKSVL